MRVHVQTIIVSTVSHTYLEGMPPADRRIIVIYIHTYIHTYICMSASQSVGLYIRMCVCECTSIKYDYQRNLNISY